MKKYSFFAALTFALTLAAGSAQALPMSLEDTLSISNINMTTSLDGDPILFDLNNDGEDDFEVSVFSTEFGEAAEINGLVNENNLSAEIFIDEEDPFSQFATIFQEGDHISLASGDSTMFATLYTDIFEGVSEGPFSAPGSTGFIGLFVVDQFENFNFGFAEITRGSITVGQVGVQTVPGSPAPVSVNAVPVPAALPLLLGAFGLFGFMGMRRKRKAAGSVA